MPQQPLRDTIAAKGRSHFLTSESKFHRRFQSFKLRERDHAGTVAPFDEHSRGEALPTTALGPLLLESAFAKFTLAALPVIRRGPLPAAP